MSNWPSLGLVPLKEGTVEHDFFVLDRFIGFSTELLRLSLLGISAVAFWLSKAMFPEGDGAPIMIADAARPLVALSLVAFASSSAAALMHRYAAADSVSWHLQAMRRYERGHASEGEGKSEDVRVADAERARRFAQFKRSRRSLLGSAIALGIGAGALAAAVVVIVW
jgi:hypothetical protein